MSKKSQKKVVDITKVELTPGAPSVCLGNGKQEFECCCDECDYFLLCFPEFDEKGKDEGIALRKDNHKKTTEKMTKII